MKGFTPYIYQTLVAFPKRLLDLSRKRKFRLIGALKGLINGLIAINKDMNWRLLAVKSLRSSSGSASDRFLYPYLGYGIVLYLYGKDQGAGSLNPAPCLPETLLEATLADSRSTTRSSISCGEQDGEICSYQLDYPPADKLETGSQSTPMEAMDKSRMKD